MKTNTYFLLFAASLIFFFSSCEKDKTETDNINFEDFELGDDGYYIGSDMAGGYTIGNAYFPINYNEEYGSWSGFAVSNHTDTETRGYSNQYSAIAGSGASGSEKYAVLYTWQADTIEFLTPEKVTNISVCNTTYAYYAMLEGTEISDPFGGDSGDERDYFNLLITGLDESGTPVLEASLALANYRYENNAEDYVSNAWTDVDLSEGGYIKYLVFSFESSDMGDFGINTPTYVCIDNIRGELQE
jgi:hypothetical protein